MGETQKATTGAKSEVWIEDSPGAGTYTELVEVKRFGSAAPERDDYESTHLKSDAKEYVPGDIDYGEFDIVVNYRAGSDTDLRLEELAASGDEVSVILIRAERGVLTRQKSGLAFVKTYVPDDAERGKVTEATATFRSSGAFTSAAYTAAPPQA